MLYNLWGGYVSSVDIENLQKLLFKAKRWSLVVIECHCMDFIISLRKFKKLFCKSILIFIWLVKTCCNWMYCIFDIVTLSNCLAKTNDLLNLENFVLQLPVSKFLNCIQHLPMTLFDYFSSNFMFQVDDIIPYFAIISNVDNY